MAILSTLSGQVPLVGMEGFAKRHRQMLNKIVCTEFGNSPSDSTFRLLLTQLDVTSFETLLRDWLAAQPGVAITQTTYATDDSGEIQALRKLLEAVELEGVQVQADALHANRPFRLPGPARCRLPDRHQTLPPYGISPD